MVMSNHWANSFDRHLVLHQLDVLITHEKDRLALVGIQAPSPDMADGLDPVSYHTGRLWALEDLRAQIKTNYKVIEVLS